MQLNRLSLFRLFSQKLIRVPLRGFSQATPFSQATVKVFAESEEKTFKELEDLVKGAKVVLFMKGSPDSPECGYSSLAAQILKRYKIADFKFVNINENPALKEMIKKFSDWPTFPQLYVNGELQGGADILLEKHKANELEKVFEGVPKHD